VLPLTALRSDKWWTWGTPNLSPVFCKVRRHKWRRVNVSATSAWVNLPDVPDGVRPLLHAALEVARSSGPQAAAIWTGYTHLRVCP
jgi:hypothetical protein